MLLATFSLRAARCARADLQISFYDVLPRPLTMKAKIDESKDTCTASASSQQLTCCNYATTNDEVPSSMYRLNPLSTQLLKRRPVMSPQSAQIQHMIRRSSSSSSSSDLSLPSRTTVEQSGPAPPLLMLEGDRFELSADGISRTAYRLKYPAKSGLLVVEELYNINKATKKFILRRSNANHQDAHDTYALRRPRYPPNPSIDLGSAYQIVELQELAATKVDAVGTGAMSWESSIAMSLFFRYNSHLLSGHILELGSGCGHGGILVLSQLFSSARWKGKHWPVSGDRSCPSVESFVFTDYQNEILAQCARNIHIAFSQSSIPSQVHFQTEILDWNSFATEDGMPSGDLPQYKTILASDCAFRYCDIEALSETIVRLLSIRQDAAFHTFGPINRGALHSLIDALKTKGMGVEVETLEMERLRLMPSRSSNICLEIAQQASTGIAKILHITARWRHAKDSNSGNIHDLD